MDCQSCGKPTPNQEHNYIEGYYCHHCRGAYCDSCCQTHLCDNYCFGCKSYGMQNYIWRVKSNLTSLSVLIGFQDPKRHKPMEDGHVMIAFLKNWNFLSRRVN